MRRRERRAVGSVVGGGDGVIGGSSAGKEVSLEGRMVVDSVGELVGFPIDPPDAIEGDGVRSC